MIKTSSTITSAAAAEPGGGGALPRQRRFGAETVFRGVVSAAGMTVLVVIVAIATFLVVKAIPSLRANRANFLTFQQWFPDAETPQFGIGAIAFGTVLTAFLALAMAVPVSRGIALCLSHYAPPRVATALGFTIDLLAAVPSVVFGLWGRDYFVGPVQELSKWLHDNLGWLPVFGSDGPYGKSVLLGSIVLAIMVLPIVTSLSREVYRQTPVANEEAALALGATKWEMVRTAVLPYGRPGVIAAIMLGLGRALGETIALLIILRGTQTAFGWSLFDGGYTFASKIASAASEFNDQYKAGAYIAAGLVLFILTFVVNSLARAAVAGRGAK
jgi:phosphate transport system permease protein